MARYKDYNYDQMKMIPVAFDRQILPGSFELFIPSIPFLSPLFASFANVRGRITMSATSTSRSLTIVLWDAPLRCAPITFLKDNR